MKNITSNEKQNRLSNNNSRLISKNIICNRCSGTGVLPQFRHIEAGICFKCRGKKVFTWNYRAA